MRSHRLGDQITPVGLYSKLYLRRVESYCTNPVQWLLISESTYPGRDTA
jgi:hypothetical protein